jgi:ApaG protein
MNRIPRRPSKDPPAYQAVTRDILVRVVPAFRPERSDPTQGRYVWTYTIEIENHGRDTVQLVSRRWEITDSQNRSKTVLGSGVMGERPRLRPREVFTYTSACPLSTPSGAMRGSYQMLTDDDVAFEVEVPAFSLHLPGALRVLN